VKTLKRVIAMAVLACLCGTEAFSDETGLPPGGAAGTAAASATIANTLAANGSLAPGKAAGVHEAQNIEQSSQLVIGLGGLLVAGVVLALSGGGGGGAAVIPMRNMVTTTTTTTTP
jgi:hypothetical protein